MKLVTIDLDKLIYTNMTGTKLGWVNEVDISNAIVKKMQEPKTGHCKDCKYWKDSDGAYRRGIGAESQCPMNRKEVYEGNGYCFLFEPQESEEV